MYTFLLYTHSWLRWAVLIAGFVLIALSLTSWMSNRPYAKKDNILSASYTGLLHLQLLIGLLLYIVYSPYTQSAFRRFWSRHERCQPPVLGRRTHCVNDFGCNSRTNRP